MNFIVNGRRIELTKTGRLEKEVRRIERMAEELEYLACERDRKFRRFTNSGGFD